MGSLKSPLLSLGAKGTIGDTLTFQERQGQKFAREKPIPAYRRTLPQVYQRWLYEDYAYLWTQQSAATQAEYRSAGVRHHLTGFQYWMKYNLTNLPDIVAWWKLDEKAGAIAYDSSRNANNGTIIGATPADGIIDGAQDFDGLNDRITTPVIIPTTGTLEYFLEPTNANGAARECFLGNSNPGLDYFQCMNWNAGVSYWGWVIAGAEWRIITAVPFPTPYFIVHLTWDNSTHIINLYWNNSLIGTRAAVPNISSPTIPIWIGCSNLLGVPDRYADCKIDNLILYSRTLDTIERQRHLERRYPA